MALTRDKIEKGKIQRLFPKVKSGIHRYMKKCINKLIWRQAKNISLNDDENITPKNHIEVGNINKTYYDKERID